MTLLRGLKSPWFWVAFVLIVGGIAAGSHLVLWQQGEVRYPREIRQRAEALHERILSFDSHIDVPPEFNTEGSEANTDGPYQFDLVKAGKGRLSGAALTVFAWPEMWNGPNAPHRPTPGMREEAQHQQEVRYQIIQNIARDYPNQAGIAYTPDDFYRLADEGKFAIVISLLNAYPFGDDLSQLDRWAARGMRMFGLSYIGNNAWADSSRPMAFFNDTPDALGGLSGLGEQAVAKLNELGVIIDVSQMSSRALEQVARLSRAPLVASHSAVRGIVDIPRNLSDRELQLIKASGGVVQVVGFPTYLKPLSSHTLEKLNQLRTEFDLPPLETLDNLAYAHMPGDPVIAIWPEQKFAEYASALYQIVEEEPKATLDDFANAIDYAVKKIGIDHVGISSDFNDGGGVVGWEDVSDSRNLTAELMQRGYSDTDIEKLWSGNFLRVWKEVRKRAAADGDPTARHQE
ncbi:MAG: dipeptidase [Parahaliea sp.]